MSFAQIGALFIAGATALFIAASVSAPTYPSLDLMHITLVNGSSVNFGVFGWCLTDMAEGGTMCTPSRIGYHIVDVIADYGLNLDISESTISVLHTLTSTFVLHPIAAGITGIAFLVSIGRSIRRVPGESVVPGIALLAGMVGTAAVAIDFAVFGQLKQYIERNDRIVDLDPTFGTALWLGLAGVITLLVAPCATCVGPRRVNAANGNGRDLERGWGRAPSRQFKRSLRTPTSAGPLVGDNRQSTMETQAPMQPVTYQPPPGPPPAAATGAATNAQWQVAGSTPVTTSRLPSPEPTSPIGELISTEPRDGANAAASGSGSGKAEKGVRFSEEQPLLVGKNKEKEV
ncbi:Ph-response regulator [Mycena kentingensis (nom. inval.)]|nr:Ph-response regulator [Mycena kentingensis (nom. inval.)]